MAPPLVFPKAMKARPRPRRSLPDSAQVPTAKEIARELAAIGKGYAKRAAIFAKGEQTRKEPSLAETRHAANALLGAPSLEAISSAKVDTLAAAARVQQWVDWKASLLRAVAHVRGPADAVEVAARALDFDLEHEGGYTNAVFVVARRQQRFWGEPWAPVRHAVCAASDERYAEARSRAEGIRKKLDLPWRAFVAYAFPDEPWGAEDLKACLASPELEARHDRWGFLLSACTDVPLVKEFAGKDRSEHTLHAYALDLAAVLPEADALAILAPLVDKLLVKPAYGPVLKTPPREVAEAIGCLRTPAASAILARYFGHAVLGPVVAAFFQEAPELRGALEGLAKGKTKAAEAAARIIEVRSAAEGPVASQESLPPVLRERLWRPVKGAKLLAAVPGLVPIEGPESVEMTQAERRTLASGEGGPCAIRDMTADELARWRQDVEAKQYAHADYEAARAAGAQPAWELARVPPAEGLKAWNEGRAFLHGTPLQFLAVHGVAALPHFLEIWTKQLGWEGGDQYLEAMLRVASPRLAPSMAHVAARRRKYRRAALGWLVKNAEVAALGLVPDAVGEGASSAARGDAREALFDLAQRGRAGAVRAAAKQYGAEAAQAVEEILGRDPLRIGAVAPKPPDYLRAADLAPVRLRAGGARLGEEAVEALLELLRVASLDPPYPGIAQVVEACEPESLGAFARDLLEQWVLAGANGRHDWMLLAVAHLPSEAGTRRVASLAREWARRDAAKAGRACAALAAIGADLALMHLGHVAETSRFEKLRAEAAALLEEAAAARGLTGEELGDRTVPDLDLGPGGTLGLDFGPRRFTVTLDEALRSVVLDAEGRRLPGLPRATKADDAAQAKAARARFDTLKSDAAAIADRQIRRVERAMVAGRSWSAEEFRERLAGHPLLVHLARRLVWEVVEPAVRFRVAEDGTFADARDGAFALGDDGVRVRVCHPLLLPDAERDAWTRLFADYQLVQPFPQLGRPLARLALEEKEATSWDRCRGLVADAGRVLGTMEARGWRREGGGQVVAFTRPCSGAQGEALQARVSISPGIPLEDVKGAPVQTLGALEVRRGAEAARLGSLAPVDFSEIARDLEALRA